MVPKRPTLRQQQRRMQLKQQDRMVARIAAHGGVEGCIAVVEEWASHTKRGADVLPQGNLVEVDFGTWDCKEDALQMLRYTLDAAVYAQGDGMDIELDEKSICSDVLLVATISRRDPSAHGCSQREALRCMMQCVGEKKVATRAIFAVAKKEAA